MAMNRRKLLRLAGVAVGLPAVSRIARAQPYPSRPVRIIVGYPAGLQPDIVARLIGQRLSARLAQQFVIENRPGASNNIGTEIAVKASPDGYTLLLVNSANAFNASLYANLNFNFIRDIAPIAIIGRTRFVMVVNPSLPAKTVPQFIAYAKANPGKINMASAGDGTPNHIFGELFRLMAGVDFTHVPYRSSYLPDLLGGQVQLAFTPITTVIEFIRAGKLRALAVTSATRAEALPDIPTVGEFVPGYEAGGWEGVGAPKGTSTEIIDRLNREINATFADPATRDHLVALGVEPSSMTPEQFGKYIGAETEKWAKVIHAANIPPE
jgi:tripartite-type tricarboxylate transporter receptor subunit TctC